MNGAKRLQQEIINIAKTCGMPGFRYVFFARPFEFLQVTPTEIVTDDTSLVLDRELPLPVQLPKLEAVPDAVFKAENPQSRPIATSYPLLHDIQPGPAAGEPTRHSPPRNQPLPQAKPRYALLSEVADALAATPARTSRARPMRAN